MSYGDVRQNRAGTIGAVVVVHAALAYALLTGLAAEVFHRVAPERTIIYDVPIPEVPPPDPVPQPKLDKAVAPTREAISAPVPKIAPPTEGDFTTTLTESEPGPIAEALPGPPVLPPTPPAVSLARGANPRGNQGDWFPSDSYPAAAQRANAEGLVSVRVTVGANGRVSDCAVTSSSGNADLDAATCRLAKRNGRFEPARDAEGQAVPSSVTLRNVRWRLTE